MGWHTGTATSYLTLLDALVAIATGSGATTLDSVVNGGTGGTYAVGDILTVDIGTPTTYPTKIRVLTVSAGQVVTAKIQEAGAYTTAPTDPVTVTGGGGTGATFNLTYASNGWASQRNTTYSGSEKEVILLGTGGGSDEILVGVRTFTRELGANDAAGWALASMVGFSTGTTYPAVQAGESPGWDPAVPGGGCFVPLFTTTTGTINIQYWFSVTPRRIIGIVHPSAIENVWLPFYIGFMNPFATASEFPYPILVVGASTFRDALFTDATAGNVTGFAEMTGRTGDFGPALFRQPDSEWIYAQNSNASGAGRSAFTRYGFYPGVQSNLKSGPDSVVSDGNFSWPSIILNAGVPAPATLTVQPTPGTGASLRSLIPFTLVQSDTVGLVDFDVLGEMDGCFWVSGAGLTDEDTISFGNDRYRVFRSGNRNQTYSYFAVKEA